MKQFYFAISVLLFMILSFDGNGQTNYRKQLYEAFIAEQMNSWGGIISDFEAEKSLQSENEKLELINYYYGYIGYLLGTGRKKDADVYLTKGEKLLDEIIDNDPDNAAAYAYKSAFCGWRIGLDHSKAPILGPRFLYCNSHAYSLDSLDIQATTDRANFYFYAPGFIGGDAQKAVALYEKAILLMEAKGLDKNNWQYFNTMILLAKANDKAGNLKEARQAYLKILSHEPQFLWVKDRLLPELVLRIED